MLLPISHSRQDGGLRVRGIYILSPNLNNMFTKKHFETIAETLRTLKNKDSFTTSEESDTELVDIEMVIDRFVSLFEDDNPLFNKEKFINYINK